MSYAICRMQKFKMRDVKGIQIHNQREKESNTNHDIESERTHLNYDLHNDGHIDYLKTVKDKIEQNVETNRAIRKDAVVMCEFVVTSDREFFDVLDMVDPAQQKVFFKEAYSFLKDRYGEQNIVHAAVHLDEKTPHMHVGMVPVTGENKLSAKQIFNRKELVSLQDDFHAHMVEKGFYLERGVSSDKKHVEMRKFKAMTAKEEINALEKEIGQCLQKKEVVNKQMEQLESRLNQLQNAVKSTNKVDKIEVKYKGGILRSKTVEMSVEDFEELKTKAKASEAFKRENTTLHRKNEALQASNTDLHTTVKRLEKENERLKPYKGKYERLGKLFDEMNKFYEKFIPKEVSKFHEIIGFCKRKVNASINRFSSLRYSEKALNENEKKGYEAASKFLATQQTQQRKERGNEREL
ncbi:MULTISPECIES: MobV family relaxase [Bacillus cereus group]|uniref:MobV family relaxase n=1 Tax=Bacillus cereus group TaxID=86661 RepID=UPI0029C39154|nr:MULTISPECIES: MobV family relaxase [unclassified Bacillus cereus group]MDX5869729.1 MobV family relaxase [Bacillus cereus group sp. BfR-BA-01119]MDX5912333.1 MobV family relaxase [Bacillus cereus group sp. BfR-BA-01029]